VQRPILLLGRPRTGHIYAHVHCSSANFERALHGGRPKPPMHSPDTKAPRHAALSLSGR
jgi:hypothetical protein